MLFSETLKSFELCAISIKKHCVLFDRDAIEHGKKIDISYSFNVTSSEDEERENFFINLSADSYIDGYPLDEKNPLKLLISIDYKFNIIDSNSFDQLSQQDKTMLLANLAYLNFRRKLITAYADADLPGMKIPLSIYNMGDFSAIE